LLQRRRLLQNRSRFGGSLRGRSLLALLASKPGHLVLLSGARRNRRRTCARGSLTCLPQSSCLSAHGIPLRHWNSVLPAQLLQASSGIPTRPPGAGASAVSRPCEAAGGGVPTPRARPRRTAPRLRASGWTRGIRTRRPLPRSRALRGPRAYRVRSCPRKARTGTGRTPRSHRCRQPRSTGSQPLRARAFPHRQWLP
jgi:hypothetical protein